MAKETKFLWGDGSPPCWRVMIAMEEKGLKACNKKMLSFHKMEHKSDEVMKMNPRGQLPSFMHEGRVINESYAACMYLETQFKANPLIPENPDECARMFQRLEESHVLNQRSGDVIYYNWKFPEEERCEATLKRFKKLLTEEVKLWEEYVKVGPFLAGETFSLADVAIYPSISYLFRNGLCQKKYPNLAAYYERLKSRPSIDTTWPLCWKENPEGENHLKEI